MSLRALLPIAACSCALLACAEDPEFATGGGPGNDRPSDCDDVGGVSDDLAEELDLDRGFYARHCSALGIDVLASARVDDDVMLEAGRIVEGMFEGREALRDAVHDRYFRVVLVATSIGEQLDDVPELSGISRGERDAAGIGPDPDFPAATMRDTVINCRPPEQDPQATPPGDTLVHEIAHAMLSMGLDHTEPEFRDRLHDAYDAARESELWKLRVPPGVDVLFGSLPTSNYLMTNPDEYWATGVSAWFGFKSIPLKYSLTESSPPKLRLEVVYGRDLLREWDQALAELLEEVFGPDPTLRPSCPEWVPKHLP